MIRTLLDKTTLMGLEFGTLYGIGMSQDTHPQHTHKAPILDVQLPREKKGGGYQGCNIRSLRKRAHRAETLPEQNLGRFFSACRGNYLTLGLSLLVTSFRK